MKKIPKEYYLLLKRLDTHSKKCINQLSTSIQCKKGCSSCCILETVGPVEFDVLQKKWKHLSRKSKNKISSLKNPEMCLFLVNNSCSIYKSRPVICRTHGLPLLIDSKIDFCPENFKSAKSIQSDCILDLEQLNTALSTINLIYTKDIEKASARFKIPDVLKA